MDFKEKIITLGFDLTITKNNKRLYELDFDNLRSAKQEARKQLIAGASAVLISLNFMIVPQQNESYSGDYPKFKSEKVTTLTAKAITSSRRKEA